MFRWQVLPSLLCLVVGFSFQGHGQALQGNVDVVSSSTCEVVGWARDPQNLAPINVSIYRDGDNHSGTLLTTVTANELRSDLPFSDQNHGFDMVFVANAGLADGRGHTIYAYGITQSGSTGALSSNGKTLNCGVLSSNASAFGAKGDGTTDDGPAIQAAIDATAPGGTVLIPAGIYMLESSAGTAGDLYPSAPCNAGQNLQIQDALIVRKVNITLTGVGRDTILVLGPNAKMRVVDLLGINEKLTKLVVDGNGLARMRIDPATGQPLSWPCGLVVDGLVAVEPLNTAARAQSNALIQDAELRHGIEDGAGGFLATGLTADNTYVHDNGGSAYGYTGAAAGGAGLEFAGGANQTATNNVVIGNTHGIVSDFGAVGVTFAFNVADSHCGWGLDLGTGTDPTPPPQPDSNFSVHDNWIEGNGVGCLFSSLGVQSGQRGSLFANYILNNYSGIYVSDPGAPWPPSLNWQITANTIRGNTQKGIWIRGRSSGITLDGNQVLDNGTNASSQVVIDPTAASGVNADWQSMNTLGYTPPATGAQTPAIASVVNAASEQPGGISPGEILVLYGTNLGPLSLVSATADSNGRCQRILAGTRVLFDGVPGAMLYTSAGQVAVMAPFYLYWKNSTNVQLEYDGVRSSAVTVAVQQSQPAIFTIDSSGSGPGAILNPDYSVNSAANPAARGSVVIIYATGEGQTDPAGIDGLLASSTLPKPRLPVSVTIGGINATVQYAGAAPTFVAGVLQVNVQVPSGAPIGAAVPIQINVGGVSSRAGVTLSVD